MTILSGDKKFTQVTLHLVALATFIMFAGILPVNYVESQENPGDTITLDLKNVDIHTLIETVSFHTGRNFIVDPRVSATVNVVLAEPVKTDELYEIFLSVLAVHGYAAVQAGNLTKVIPASAGLQSAVPFFREHEDTGDKLVSQIVHLKSTSALQLVKALRPLLPESATLSADGTGNTIVITDRAANIEKLIELISLMDGQ